MKCLNMREGELFTCAYTHWEAATRGVLQKKILKNFTKFTRKQASGLHATLLKERLQHTGVFLWILQIFSEYLFYRMTLGQLLLYLT